MKGKLAGGGCEAFVKSPEGGLAQTGGGEELGVGPTNAPAKEPMEFEELEALVEGGDAREREPPQVGEGLAAVLQVARGEFTDDDGVAQNEPFLQQGRQCGRSRAEVGHPDRCINQDHEAGWRRVFVGVWEH